MANGCFLAYLTGKANTVQIGFGSPTLTTFPIPAGMTVRLFSWKKGINPRRKLHAHKFQREASRGRILELIAWLEGDGHGCSPA
ncbi:MAG TPA: hypothetical protein EYG03_15405 [Planctomycetes bacterium]|nr:hypothetical protein [Fuerstiella sp.]HIK93345.1 hypothetical protein [Planctomycetota bacterium]